jgi:Cdc6-like AAA superfamily ATPase
MSISIKSSELEELVVEQGTLVDDLTLLSRELCKTRLSKKKGYVIVVSGDAGSGKTTLVKKFREKATELIAQANVNEGVVYMKMPSNPVGKGLYVKILQAIGTPSVSFSALNNLKEPEQIEQIRKLIENKKVRVLILDEFQHATEKMGERKMRTTADFLKEMIDDFPVLFVFAGTEKVQALLKNDQFSSRSSIIRKELISIRNKTRYKDYLKYLKTLQHHLNLPGDALDSPTIALPIYFDARGDLRVITDIIQTALMVAEEKDSKTLRRSHFKEAWKERYKPKEGENIVINGNPWKAKLELLMQALDINYEVE